MILTNGALRIRMNETSADSGLGATKMANTIAFDMKFADNLFISF